MPDTTTDNTFSGETETETEESLFKLVDGHGEIVESGIGLLLYKRGTVCNDGFNETVATAICGAMGYSGFSHWLSEPYYRSPSGKLKFILVEVLTINIVRIK